ncbi:bifunctional 4-hydroxy-2-oxoglutarate aldolase/2-dehydro-3-deoxy-phosphogluconate aldolase [Rufibacter glacialis]|uniref:Bifunctional 4-hydroxy-2-oxoglutarate aldolase/2-dehydro-3-deoxy-phosphogluconate aldolase n=1 Tax=Rufibacter glacialis TaxID=1259555 RepID=A0A5M8Q6H4_9BACT|nr:bifunctional 4-hydroxy-2-oxoglutarate aldolase/2-dehydro-3-deoxy-phosphogluconate aldolase [Rufibacter glacialis]KAA6430671.1 bifunctional 4-hydroxy-2-oxoglutarate aldolase/2-dehydro-3-deoxy-phosphogluconate aldolase [Rufibacter glacialis]GGK85656.1 bifunctional 4-hydroxy-2-oxoglutarate aldolase/2-dehydro-3-deoxy-phosphogluconate aldolase [Rufibacter glacialis]
MPTKETALQAIVDQGLLPLFFYENPEVSLEIIKTLYKAGVRTLEYTNRGPAALENFTFLKSELKTYQDLHLGIGTIKTVQQANDFLKAGADYVVAPIVDPQVGNLVHEAGLLWIPGCFSPTEIHTAQTAKAGLIKLFPANILGPAFLSSIKELFPGQPFIPTGGVEMEEENIRTWFKAGVCAVGMGSKLIGKDILAGRQYDRLSDLTQQALQLVKANRS